MKAIRASLVAMADALLVLARDLGQRKVDKFYVVVPIDEAYDHDKKRMQDLSRGVLEGVKGISEHSQIIMQWYGISRNGILIMDADALMKINKLSRLQYDNPSYLVSNGMAALYRIFDKEDTPSGRVGLAGNILDHMMYALKGDKVKWAAAEAKAISARIQKARAELTKAIEGLPADPDTREELIKIVKHFWLDDLTHMLKKADEAAKHTLEFANTSRRLVEVADLYLNLDSLNLDAYREAVADKHGAVERVRDWGYDKDEPELISRLLDALEGVLVAMDGMTTLRQQLHEEEKTATVDQQFLWNKDDLLNATEKAFREGTKDVDSVKSLASKIRAAFLAYPGGYQSSELKKVPQAAWDRVVLNGLKHIASTFKDEGEWLVKDQTLRVPRGSLFYITASNLPPDVERRRQKGQLTKLDEFVLRYEIKSADKYDSMIERYGLAKRYKIRRIDHKKMEAARSKWHLKVKPT